MPKNHATTTPQINTLTSSVNLISVFSLFDSKRKPIAKNLSFDQVKPISDHIDGSIIKFEKMMEVSA